MEIIGEAARAMTSEGRLQRCRRRLFVEPADVARAALPAPYALGTPYSWDRIAPRLAGPHVAELYRRAQKPG